ncbi:CHAT domain-containing protein [Sorangium sp. So ce118]
MTRHLVKEGDSRRKSGDLDTAGRLYEQALHEDPTCVDALFGLGAVASHRGDPAAAGEWARRALAIEPEYQPALLLLHSAQLDLEQHEDAQHTLVGWAQIGLRQEKSGQYAEAEATLRSILEHDPGYVTRFELVARYHSSSFFADLHHALARVLQKQDNAKEAQLHYHLARRVDPQIKLDPMYTEILSEEDLDVHPYFEVSLTRPRRPGQDAELAEKVNFVASQARYEDAASAAADLRLHEHVDQLARIIRALQHAGVFFASAKLRVVGDLAAGDDARGLFEGLSRLSWVRMLEIAELWKKGQLSEADALVLAGRIEVEPDRILDLLELFWRFGNVEPETGKYVTGVARACLTRSREPAVRAVGHILWGDTCYLLEQHEEAEKAHLRACDELEGEPLEGLAVRAFEGLCNAQRVLRKHDAELQNAERFSALAAARGGPRAQAEAEAAWLLARVLARQEKWTESLAAALRAKELIDTHGLEGRFREDVPTHIAALRRLLADAEQESAAERAAPAEGSPEEEEDAVAQAEREIEGGEYRAALERLRRLEALAFRSKRWRALIKVLTVMGRALRATGELAEADKVLWDALQRANREGPDADRFVILAELSLVAESKGALEEAVSWLEKALADSTRKRSPEREAWAHHRLAQLLVETDPLRAIEHMRKVIEAQPSGRVDRPAELERGREAYRAHRFHEAIEAYETWLAGDPPRDELRAEATANLAVAHFATGDVDRSLRLLEEAADLFLALGRPGLAVEVLSRAVTVHLRTERDAGRVLAKLIAAAESVEAPGERRSALVTAAEAAATLENYAEAERIADAALSLATSEDRADLGAEVACRMTLGRAYRATGRLSRALAEYTSALAIAQRLSDKPLEGTIRGWKAVAHRYLNEPHRAVEEYSMAIEIARRHGGEGEVASHQFNMASALLDLERKDDALHALQAALPVFDGLGLQKMSRRILMMLAQYWNESELPPEIAVRLELIEEESLASEDRAVQSWANSQKAKRLAARGELDEAERLYVEVISRHLEARDPYNAGAACLALARVLHGASPGRAQREAERALELARSVGHRLLIADCLELLTYIAMDTGPESAIEQRLGDVLGALLEIRGSLRSDGDRIRYASDSAARATGLAARFIERGQLDRAFELIEWGRAQALGDLIASRLEAVSSSPSPSTPGEGYGAGEGPEDGADLLRGPVLPEVVTAVRAPLNLGETARLLCGFGRAVALVGMSYVDDRLVGFVLRSGEAQPELVPTGLTRADVSALLSLFRTEMHDMLGAGALSWLSAGSRLLRPFERFIRHGDLVIFLLDSDLEILPLSAIELAPGERLIDRAAVCYAPSATVLGQLAERKATRRGVRASKPTKLLSVGIAYPREAIAVITAFDGMSLTGDAIDKRQIQRLLPDFRIIHVSSHGHFDSEMPTESGIHLLKSGSALLAHILSVRDLSRWALDCDLITLSTCESGRGQPAASEYLGLTRNLLAAGADSVVATLWPVDQEPTLHFMVRFYHELSTAARRAPSVDVAECLRQAQIAIGREVELAGWAAFKLVGWPTMTVDEHVGSEREPNE